MVLICCSCLWAAEAEWIVGPALIMEDVDNVITIVFELRNYEKARIIYKENAFGKGHPWLEVKSDDFHVEICLIGYRSLLDKKTYGLKQVEVMKFNVKNMTVSEFQREMQNRLKYAY